jgi:hypothetical protein
MWKRLIEWNAFEDVVVDPDGEEQTVASEPRVIREQRISTRVYLILLIGE